jgi:hypothetical protein
MLFVFAVIWGGLIIAGIGEVGRGVSNGWMLWAAALLMTAPLIYAWRRLARFVRGRRKPDE